MEFLGLLLLGDGHCRSHSCCIHEQNSTLGCLGYHLRSISETTKNNFPKTNTGIQIEYASKNLVADHVKRKTEK